MKQVTLNIPDNKFAFFMQLVQSLNFVQVADGEHLESKLSPSENEIWQGVKKGFEEVKEVKQGKRIARSVQSLLEELDA